MHFLELSILPGIIHPYALVTNIVFIVLFFNKNYRYVLCELIFPDQKDVIPHIDTRAVYYAVKDALLDTHGDYGLGALQFSLSGTIVCH